MATPVWCSYDGTHILVNTARGRQKDRNMTAAPQVTVLAIDPQNPYRYLEVRGTVAAITEEGALDHINTLARLYVDRDDYYSMNPDQRGKETRVMVKPGKLVRLPGGPDDFDQPDQWFVLYYAPRPSTIHYAFRASDILYWCGYIPNDSGMPNLN